MLSVDGAEDLPYADNLNLALLLGVALFFFFATPAMSIWFSTGRFTQGWMLAGKKEGAVEEQWGLKQGLHRVVSMHSVVVPAAIHTVSAWLAK